MLKERIMEMMDRGKLSEFNCCPFITPPGLQTFPQSQQLIPIKKRTFFNSWGSILKYRRGSIFGCHYDWKIPDG
jgi:hypothetical protein